MKRVVSFVLLSFVGVLPSFAQAPKSSLLWEISGNGLTHPSYLFGTFHIMCKNDFVISEALKSKLSQAKQFFAEVKIDDPGVQQKMMAAMVMPGRTIQSFMTEPEFKAFSDSFQKIAGMPFAMFNNFKPFMALSILTINSIACNEKIQPEGEFIKLADEMHIPVLGLETVEDQMNAINKTPLDSQVYAVKQMVLNFDSTKRELKKMIETYKKRNIDSIYQFINAASGETNMEKDLVITRNQNWLPVITKAIVEKPSFFAVGAGHLGGTEGIISLLRKRGYRVTPVMF